MSGVFMSIFQGHTTEAILSPVCHRDIGPIPSGYGNTEFIY